MTPESPTTTVAGQGATRPMNVERHSSILRATGIFLFEMFTVYQHGIKRSTLEA